MLCDLSPDQYPGVQRRCTLAAGRQRCRRFVAHTALLHADPGAHDLGELIVEMAERTQSGYVFGGLVGSRSASVQFASGSAGHLRGQGAVGGVFHRAASAASLSDPRSR